MSNPITAARAMVAAALNSVEELQVHQFVPNRISAPAAVVAPGSPYLEPGRVLGEKAVSLRVRLFASGTNETVTESLDELIVNVTEALDRQGLGWAVSNEPALDDETFDQAYLTADITIRPITFKGGA